MAFRCQADPSYEKAARIAGEKLLHLGGCQTAVSAMEKLVERDS